MGRSAEACVAHCELPPSSPFCAPPRLPETMPHREASPPRAESQDSPDFLSGEAHAHSVLRILVVDDEEAVRTLIAEILELEGHEVVPAANGAEAVSLATREPFDVAIVDLIMPDTDGMAVLKELTQRVPLTDVIMVTGHGSIEVAVEAMKLGAVDFVTKPFSNSYLKIVVGKVLERRNLIRAAREREYYKRLSRQDGLTELYNHRFFHQLVESEVSRARRFEHKISLFILDIDSFKAYNDSQGHPAGDRALKAMAALLVRSCRKYDYVARYGGDEFAILSPGSDSSQSMALARRILARTVEMPVLRDDIVPHGRMSLSIGIATFPVDAAEKAELLEAADQALYEAKKKGRDQAVCYRDLHPVE